MKKMKGLIPFNSYLFFKQNNENEIILCMSYINKVLFIKEKKSSLVYFFSISIMSFKCSHNYYKQIICQNDFT